MIFSFIMVNSIYFIPNAKNAYVTGFLIISWLITLGTIPITVRRLHDSNLSGLYYLVTFIPNVLSSWANFAPSEISIILWIVSAGFGLYFLYLVFRKGDEKANNYGLPNPHKKYTNKTINLICVLILILIIVGGIIATL